MSDNSNARVQHDEQANRYVLEVDGQALGLAEYQPDGSRRVFTHTEVDQSLEGQGMGSLLIREALDDTRRQGKRIVPVCEFVAAYVKKHHDWDDIVERSEA
ncbi:GNAT family N-acetyltransferase [Stutzerimonas stutzeri]|uniref:GNAT family N-acetyltransferase n=1 Tax=Stutzerimonas stutzeri TaxID=316 RepID=UPI001C2E62C4|nr:GNAT family N-acetyltransferase [Stutzerimonas stutzeri]